MTGFGRTLQARREDAGTSLETISRETRISIRHLQAVEEEDFGALPGGVFRRGIVKAYVGALGLDPEEWMERFQATYAEHPEVAGADPGSQDWTTFAQNVKRNRAVSSHRSGLRWLGVLLMLVFLAGAAWGVWRYLLEPRLR